MSASMKPGPKWTEASAVRALRSHFDRPGNGGSGEYAFLAGVRDGAGFDANRTYDAVSISLWPSRGLEIHVYEIKVSRTDWLRELKKPAKAESACAKAERFSIVAPEGIVAVDELPLTWGLIELKGTPDDCTVRTKRAAPALRDLGTTVSRSFLVGLLRSCPGAIPGGKVLDPTEQQLQHAERKGYQDGHAAGCEAGETRRQWRLRELEVQAEDAKKLSAALVRGGVPPYEASLASLVGRADAIAQALAGRRADARLQGLRGSLAGAIEALDAYLVEEAKA